MKKFNGIFKTCRIVSFVKQSSVNCNICLPTNPKDKLYISPSYVYVNTRAMAQKSIMSFFKVTPKKSSGDTEEKIDKDQLHSDEPDGKQSLTPDIKRSSKRLRSNSDESKSPQAMNNQIFSSPTSLEKKKQKKRQRIESSESEAEAPDRTSDSPKSGSECESSVKKEKKKLKTYDSPKSKKAKGNQKIKEEVCSPKLEEKKVKKSTKRTSVSTETNEEKLSPMGKKKSGTKNSKKNISLAKEEDLSPERKENGENNSNSKITSPANKTKKENSPPKKKNAFEILRTKRGALDNENGVKNEKNDDDTVTTVPATEYNPAKVKYHPVKDACWRAGEPVPYLALAKTLEVIEATSARLKMVDILSNYLRSVIALTPEDLLPSIYMCLNQLAPAYHGLELGIAETYLMKAVGQCTGRSLAQMKAAAQKAGDLGRVAEEARATQRTVFAPPPLTARKVFQALKEVAQMTGQASVNKKISKIQSLYVACRQSEARYLIRSLEGKLRVGLAEQSLLQALALAAARTPPAGERAGALDVAADMSADSFKALVDEFALIVKTTYCECPNYELIVPVLLEHGVRALPAHCRLTPGVPLKPMLAHPTKGVHEVFNRFENEQFTCEYKYDGERAQIHVPGHDAPDYASAAVYSRNQENNTSKYPDVLARLPDLLTDKVTSCVLDCEAVAYDPAADQILPFQVLSTRKRKDASATEIKVQVCVFVFDLLFLNGRALVREPLAERRRLLREHFREHKGTWQFAVHRDCSSMEEVQQFLDEAVRASCEGLMVKTLSGEHARYDIARRSHNWLKLKKDYLEGVGDTIDAVVLGGYRGRGRRAGAFGGFLLACREPRADEYQSLCKLGTGFSDEDLRTLSEALEKHLIDGPKNYYRYDSSHAPDAWFEAACVWEVRCADLSLSPAHRAAMGLVAPDKGISLRFPRFIRVREDKAPEQATSAQQIAEMYLAQDQVQNTKGSTKTARLAEDDFY